MKNEEELREEVNTPSAISGWARYLLPSITDLFFIVLLTMLAGGAISERLLRDGSIGWHIRDGERMLATHALTRTDPFSSTMQGQTWYAWEWLYDLIIGGMHRWTGLNGVVFFAALIVAITFAWVLRNMLKRATHPVVAIVLLLLAISASMIHLYARPHILTWLFAVIWFEVLDRSEVDPQRSRDLFWLPLLMLVWVNVHGGFLLGFALLGIYFIAAAIGYVRSDQGAHRSKELGVVTVLCGIASLVNPYGYKLYAHIYGYLTNRFLMSHIDEFRSPNFHGAAEQCFATLLLLTLIALAQGAAARKLRWSHLLLIVFSIYIGLNASRNLPISSILLVLIIGPMLSRSLSSEAHPQAVPWLREGLERWKSFGNRMAGLELRLRGHLWPAVVVVLGLIACANQGKLGPRQVMNAHFDAKRFPVQAVEMLANSDIHDPIFAPDYWGGYLIYALYPHNKVVLDDRHDLYGEAFLRRYLQIINVGPQWAEAMNSTGANWVLAPAESPLANILTISPAWAETYSDKVAVLFKRK